MQKFITETEFYNAGREMQDTRMEEDTMLVLPTVDVMLLAQIVSEKIIMLMKASDSDVAEINDLKNLLAKLEEEIVAQ